MKRFLVLVGFGVLVWLLGQAEDNTPDKVARSTSAPGTETQTIIPAKRDETATPPTGLLGADKASLFVSGSRVNVRIGPGVRDKILGQLNLGEEVTLLSASGGWREIETKFGVGWMSADYLANTPPQPARAEPKSQKRARNVSVPTTREIQAARNEIIRQSLSTYPGSCPCPYNGIVPGEDAAVEALGLGRVDTHRFATTVM
ncbi:SH3 domain-containing protein [uncultured Roseobacter sp.]|uniref:SH3 domain-containing protein n=1 Tax=uncultured Roseobacter sp. TaxID=114847 RepID=UPI0026397E9C|nr:SH3 domain-containing protein [uncultured Roseobacter sp.]